MFWYGLENSESRRVIPSRFWRTQLSWTHQRFRHNGILGPVTPIPATLRCRLMSLFNLFCSSISSRYSLAAGTFRFTRFRWWQRWWYLSDHTFGFVDFSDFDSFPFDGSGHKACDCRYQTVVAVQLVNNSFYHVIDGHCLSRSTRHQLRHHLFSTC